MFPEGFCRWVHSWEEVGTQTRPREGQVQGARGERAQGRLTPGGLGVSGGAEHGCEPQGERSPRGRGPVSREGGGIIFTFA